MIIINSGHKDQTALKLVPIVKGCFFVETQITVNLDSRYQNINILVFLSYVLLDDIC